MRAITTALTASAVTGHVDQRPIVASLQNDPNPSLTGQLVTFLASGVSDPDGTVSSVSIYRDKDGDGSWDPVKDQLLGYATDLGGGDWSLTVLNNWQPGVTPLYFAVATDNEGYQGLPTATLNQNPVIASLQADQSTVTLGSEVNLEAVGVQDLDGSISNVVFSVNSLSFWWPNGNSPTDQLVDNSISGGWSWPNLRVDWSITDIVQADFNNDGYMDLAVSVDVTGHDYTTGTDVSLGGAGPDFISIMTNDGTGKFQTTSMVTLYSDQGHEAVENYDPVAMTVGDFNEDGAPDLAVADAGPTYLGVWYGRISVLMNDGAGGFSTYTDYLDQYHRRPLHAGPGPDRRRRLHRRRPPGHRRLQLDGGRDARLPGRRHGRLHAQPHLQLRLLALDRRLHESPEHRRRAGPAGRGRAGHAGYRPGRARGRRHGRGDGGPERPVHPLQLPAQLRSGSRRCRTTSTSSGRAT